MADHTLENPVFTHVGWQHGNQKRIEERDHLALHLDAPAPIPSEAPIFQAVDDAGVPSPALFFEPSASDDDSSSSPLVVFGSTDANPEQPETERTSFS